MQKFRAKLWTAGALAATCMIAAPDVATAADAPPPPPSVETIFPGDFNKALSLMMMGEGGEAGIGLNRLWPTLSAPALTAEQIKKSVGGNSLTIEHHYTMQFSTDGKIGGYHLKYAELALDKCPKKEVIGDGFLLHDGKCNSRTEVPWSGTWTAGADHKLCVDMKWDGGTLKDCYNMFFVLDSVGLVQPDGMLFGKAHKLKKGAAKDE